MQQSIALVGRDREMALVADRIERARRGRGAVVLIEGEAGSGKTTLLDRAAVQAAGFEVSRAAGHEVDRGRPFGVVSDAFGLRLAARDPRRAALARAVRASPDTGMAEVARYQVVEDVVSLVERLALARSLLIAIDDLQWADESSLLVLHHVARRIEHLPVLMVVTRRPLLPIASDPLADLADNPTVDRVTLEPLDDAQVVEIATGILGASPAAALRDLLAKAGGNPFFVRELLAVLRDERTIDIRNARADISIVGARPDLRLVILRRLSGLASATVEALRMAAILGETFAARELAIALSWSASDLVAPLAEAVASEVLRSEGDRLAFRHDLVREALYNDMPTSVRQALHLQVAQALADAGIEATRVAPHYERAAPTRDEAAIRTLRAAAAELATSDSRTAERWLRRALDLMGEADERHDDVALDLCQTLSRHGDVAAVEQLASTALARPQPPERRAALRRTLAAALDRLDRCLDASAVSALESRATDLDEIERVRFAAQAVETRSHVDHEGAVADAQDVLRSAANIGDPIALSRVLAALYHAAMWRGDYHAALELAEQFVVVAGDDPDIVTGSMVGRALAGLDRLPESIETLRREVARHEARRDMRLMTPLLTELARSEMAAGRWDEALSNVEAGHGLSLEFEYNIRHDEAAVLLARMALRRGEIDRAAALLGGLRAARRFVATMADSEFAEARGSGSGALLVLRDGWDLAARTGRTSDLPRYGPNLVRLELAAGEESRARAVAEAVTLIAQERAIDSVSVAALRCNGWVEGDPDRLAQAADIAQAAGLVDTWATVSEDLGVALAGAGRTAEAIEPLTAAAGYAEGIGAGRDVQRLESRLRELGIRRGRRGARARPSSGWASLTETERRVVDLAAEGLTNSEVGARLFISGRTVERHLTHVYGKLGISSRVELARIAAAH